MKKICFGKNITSVNNKMTNLTTNIKSSLREVYRFPQNLVDVSNCFNGCVNLTKFEAELPNTIKNMSSSFEGCGNFYKNVAIPSDCIDMSRSFKGAGIKGSINIPDKVVDMRESFKDSKLEAVSFNENISYFNNFQESFLNCKTLAYVYGNLPQSIVNGEGSFKNTGVTEVNFFKENSFINNADKMFEHCKNLVSVGNIKSNSFLHTWNGCSNLKSIGIINGVLNFNNTFNGCHNYSDVVYLHPYFDGTDNSYLSIGDSDRSFLNNQALRIYGVGHGLDNELNFQNAHLDRGDYISGYCDPDDFESFSSDTFVNYKGVSLDICIPKYFRTNLLDSSTRYVANFANSFKDKFFNSVYLYGGIYENSFSNSKINSLLDIKSFASVGNNTFSDAVINSFNMRTDTVCNYVFKNAIINNGILHHDFIDIEESAFTNAFLGNIKTSGINSIGPNAFRNSVKGLIYSEYDNYSTSINCIMENSFRDSNAVLKSTSYSIDSIHNNAFRDSKIVNNINFYSTKNIGEYALYNTSIANLNLPDNIQLMHNSLNGMNSLVNLNIYTLNIFHFGGSYSSTLKNVVLRNSSQIASSTNKLYSVENITMLKGGTIVNHQFYNLPNLRSFNYGGSVDVIGNYAFANCVNLTDIEGYSAEVNAYAFKNCLNLKSFFTFGHVGHGAFSGCSSLRYLEYVDYKRTSGEIGDLERNELLSGGRGHIGMVFDAIVETINNYTRITNDNGTYQIYPNSQSNILYHNPSYFYIGNHGYFDNDHEYYLDRSKIPTTLTDVYVKTDWTNDKFKGMDTLVNVRGLSHRQYDDSGWGTSTRYYNAFNGCNSLKTIDITLQRTHWNGYANVHRLYPRYLGLQDRRYNYYISYGYTISNCNASYAFGDFRGNLYIDVYVNNSTYDSRNWFDNVSVGNYQSNITRVPTIRSNKGNIYNSKTTSGLLLTTSGIAFSNEAKYYGSFSGDSKYYYFSKNTQLLGTPPVYDNCVFWFDRLDATNSVKNYFKNTTNSIIYLNGCEYSSATGINTTIVSKIFNLQEIIDNDINVRE